MDAELKTKLLDMMKWFHEFCLNNGIRYYALGGTMLGAARHHGFIPWDDDIDVGVPRNDYEKLDSLLSNAKGRYRLETPYDGNDDFIFTYSKLYDTHTTFIEKARFPIKRGIYIDIFPLDGLGDTLQESAKIYKKIDMLHMLLVARVTTVNNKKSKSRNTAVQIARLIPSFVLSNKKLIHKIDSLCKSRKFEECEYGGNLLGHWRFKEVMNREIMGTPTLYDFEDMQIFGAEKYDEYLKNLYGDWHQLPPKEKQVSDHGYLFLDLHTSYLQE